ncbi:FAD-dependent oxidoreductase [Nocardia yunnanensis]|uniref:FAD-dependent oxidoreductase n=1 Tax=Nocardia yunnanensis TaxID=2382165 RepID=A0A386ZF76_9NOCA|nr:FAD-dependent oxidoreductase [Nocardia yunnanensis]AYF75863.1 FAD-dependent oxidoreductase [Nocardia yunnanensis]
MSSGPRGGREVAVVGSGVAGLAAAYVLAGSDRVTLYERDGRLGGHAHTHEIEVGAGRRVGVDSGFIVHNERTYPTLLRLFGELGVATRETDMSMSVRADDIGLEYAGAKGVGGLFPNARALVRPRHLAMLAEVPRFHRAARELLREPDSGVTLAEFLRRHRFDRYFVDYFMTPLVAAVWSCEPAVADRYPAHYLFRFLEHHGMLTVYGSPRWRTVVGGSARYVEKIAARIDEIHTGTAVLGVEEHADHVLVRDIGGVRRFEAVVIATHPRQALAMLATPSLAARSILGAMPYSVNHARLHTDETLLPRSRRARASWNYLVPARPGEGVTVTYDLTRLMGLEHVRDRRFLVTLGGGDRIADEHVLAEMTYEHPLYTPESVAAQSRLPELDTDRVAFAGAYHGWGFHEDGALSGVRAAERIGGSWDARPAATAPVRVEAR